MSTISSDVDSISSDVDFVSNVGMIKNNSVFRNVQKGQISQTVYEYGSKDISINVSIAPVANVDKCIVTLENMKSEILEGSASIEFNGYTLTNGSNLFYINVKITNRYSSGSSCRVKLTGSWKIMEYY